MFVIIVALALVVFGAVDVHSHCHNDEPCEDVHNDVISEKRWQTNHNNVVRYYVNNNFLPILPSLFPDVTEAAEEWSEIWYEPEREEVNFALDFQGSTTLSPTGNSQHNIVGWGSLFWNYNDGVGIVAQSFPVYSTYNPNRIVGADIVMNYHAPLAPHSAQRDDMFCIKNILTHEFGHWIRLLEADAEGEECDDYADYTMFNDAGVGMHYQEDLACEDKYCAWYTYNEMRWTATPNAAARLAPPADVGESLVTQLLHNYPDPFNPETWIPFELARDANVTIDIYDSNGGIVRTLAVGDKPKGSYIEQSKAVYWDGKNNDGESVASGVYFYTLTADDFSQTKRLVILK